MRQTIEKGTKLSDKHKKALQELRTSGSSARHIASMRMFIMKGASFDDAHKQALKSVGK